MDLLLLLLIIVAVIAVSGWGYGTYAYRPVPGASPEPIREGAGLRGKEDLEAFLDGIMAAHLQA